MGSARAESVYFDAPSCINDESLDRIASTATSSRQVEIEDKQNGTAEEARSREHPKDQADPSTVEKKKDSIIAYVLPKPLLEFSNLPEYLQDNEFIHKHYRADWPLSQALWSIFGIHNETGNIWTHLIGFLVFVAITVYTVMMMPSAVEIPLAASNMQRLHDKMPPAPSLTALREALASQLPPSLSDVELPQLKRIQETLSNVKMPQIRQLQQSLARMELPHLPGSFEAFYNSLPPAPHLDLGARLEAMYDALPALPRLPHLLSLEEIRLAAQHSGEVASKQVASLYGAMPDMGRVRKGVQDAVTEGLSHLPHLPHMPNLKEMQDAAGPYLTAMSSHLPHLPHLPRMMPNVAGEVATRLSQLELLHTLHGLEVLMSGAEVTRIQEALHSLVGYYACVMNNAMLPATSGDTCPLDGGRSTGKETCAVEYSSSVNASHMPAGETLYDRAFADKTCPTPVLYGTPTVRWPLFLFLGGAMVCLLLSATCHLLGCISCDVSRVLWRFDYAGIAALLSSSFFPPVYYAFLCQPGVRTVYLTAVVLMGVFTVAVSLLPQFQTTQYRYLRAGMFFGMGVSGIIPTMHKFFFFYDEPVVVTTTLLELLMGSMYGLGAMFYATRIPERWLPGKFDIAGHSHQIFHILVILGAYTHYRTGLLYLQWRDLHGCGST